MQNRKNILCIKYINFTFCILNVSNAPLYLFVTLQNIQNSSTILYKKMSSKLFRPKSEIVVELEFVVLRY